MILTPEKAKKVVDDLLTEMFKRVDRPYDRKFCKKDNWYIQSEWTKEEEDAWIAWCIDRLVKTYKFTKKAAEEEMFWINLNYGWKIKAPAKEDSEELFEFDVAWSKTYYATGTQRVKARTHLEAQLKVEDMIGDLEGSIQYDPECDTVESINKV
jgi:hypothetical protein